jgi:flavin-dependent dehydrogenase
LASKLWNIAVKGQHSFNLVATHIIDATGRRCAIARAAGARREPLDKLVGLVTWMSFEKTHHHPHTVLVEAVENGWWYSAPVPGERLVVAYMTDADELDRRLIGNNERYLEFVSAAPLTAARVADGTPVLPPRVWLAGSAMTLPCVGEGWITTGDAAASFDPLSSLGIGYAMLSGIQAARAVDHRLNGNEDLAATYEADVARHMTDYLTQRQELYRLEQRWPDRPFWSRRHTVPAVHSATARRTLASAEWPQ